MPEAILSIWIIGIALGAVGFVVSMREGIVLHPGLSFGAVLFWPLVIPVAIGIAVAKIRNSR